MAADQTPQHENDRGRHSHGSTDLQMRTRDTHAREEISTQRTARFFHIRSCVRPGIPARPRSFSLLVVSSAAAGFQFEPRGVYVLFDLPPLAGGNVPVHDLTRRTG